MTREIRWGVCATISAPAQDILSFAAHYIDAGAHRVWVCLDTPAPEASQVLKAHPKCRVTTCDAAYWQRAHGRRPRKHQVRQCRNATHIYNRAGDVDWLLHADVDEFLIGPQDPGSVLETLPDNVLTARIRPMEALARTSGGSGPQAFKTFIPPGPERQEIVASLYPTYGAYLRGGFLSHVAGKIFVRTGMKSIDLRIHNVFQGDKMNPGAQDLRALTLAHLHAQDWDSWRARFDYRLDKGAYRAELPPARAVREGGVTLHAFLAELMATRGDAGLREFFDEVAGDSAELRQRLEALGHLAIHDLALDAKLARHFPGISPGVATV